MPNQRNAIFIVSSMPNRAMKAGRNAVIGMERIGAATGLIRSWSQRKLPMRMPRGIAITALQKNACAMRHQLWNTFAQRLFSVHRRRKAFATPAGGGSENGGRI